MTHTNRLKNKAFSGTLRRPAPSAGKACHASPGALARRGLQLFAALAVFATPVLAQAQVISVGNVTRLTPHAGDVVIFDIAGPRLDSPACSTMGTEWAISLSTPTGRAMYAMLLLAHAQNRPMRVFGSGICLSWTQRAEAVWMQPEN